LGRGLRRHIKVLAQAPWASDFDPLEGFILHETEAGRMKFEE
jgi:hypothetical protein